MPNSNPLNEKAAFTRPVVGQEHPSDCQCFDCDYLLKQGFLCVQRLRDVFESSPRKEYTSIFRGDIPKLQAIIDRLASREKDSARLEQELKAANAQLGAWRWLHWGKKASWVCECANALGYAVNRCFTCGMNQPAKPIKPQSPSDTGSR